MATRWNDMTDRKRAESENQMSEPVQAEQVKGEQVQEEQTQTDSMQRGNVKKNKKQTSEPRQEDREIAGRKRKNILPKVRSILQKGWRWILAFFFLLPGVFILVYVSHAEYNTEVTWKYGFLANVCLGACIICVLPGIIRRIYQNWIPDYGDFFEDWKKNWRIQQITLGIIAGILFILAAWFFSVMKSSYGWLSPGYVTNYAPGYLLFSTVAIQGFIVEIILTRFMHGRLQMLMEHMQEINRMRLSEALEIERQSLEKVSRSDQLRVDLITNVSHDLKTPLTSMVGYIELMKKEELSDTARDYLEVISRRAGKLKEMIESLFNLAKASSGNIELKKEKINVNRLLEQLMADMEDRIKDSGLQYIKMLAKEDTSFETDNTYLYRICQNLIENTLKYSAKGTRVFVKTFVEENVLSDETGNRKEGQQTAEQHLGLKQKSLCIEITNTAGYPMDFSKEDIVERFARADKARSTDGNGLGLAIVSTYAASLGGEFDILMDCDQFKAKLAFPL